MRRILVAALAVPILALTGCAGDKGGDTPAAQPPASSAPVSNGVAALGADEILTKAKAALKAAKSFRATGSVADEGQKTDLDLAISADDFLVSMAFGEAKVQLLAVGGKKYFKPNEQFLVMSTDAKQGAAIAEVVGDRWVAGAEKDASFKEMFSIADIDQVLKPTGTLSKGEEKVIDGQPAIALKDSDDPDASMWIATTGEPYPLKLSGKDGDLVFSAFGEPVTDIKAPADTEVIDMSKLNGK